MPKRRGRNEDPTGRQGKQARSAAIKAAKIEKAQGIQKSIRDLEDAKGVLAEMEVDESFFQKHERQHRIRHRSDLQHVTAGKGVESDEDEFISIDVNSDLETETEPESTDESNVTLEKKQVSLINIIQMYNSQINLESKTCDEGCQSKLVK